MISGTQLRTLAALVLGAGFLATGMVLAAPADTGDLVSTAVAYVAKPKNKSDADAITLFKRVYGRAPNRKNSNDTTVLKAYTAGLAKHEIEKAKLKKKAVAARRGCPLTTALVQRVCEVPAAVGLTLHDGPGGCEVRLVANRDAVLVNYASAPFTSEQWESFVQETTEGGRLAQYPIPGLGDRAVLFGSVPVEESKGMKDLGMFGFVGPANLLVAKGFRAYSFETRGQQQRHFVPMWCSPKALQELAKKIVK